MLSRIAFSALLFTTGASLPTTASAETFSFTTGNPDARLGALSGISPKNLETETADDFVLTDTTVISGATITGLVDAPFTNITEVEVEFYHVFPLDSGPPSGNVLSRVNSPSDHEIATATRDSAAGTLTFSARSLNAGFAVSNTVVTGINKSPNSTTKGEGPASGDPVQVTITFSQPIVLPAGHYFFRPEVLLTGGKFLYLSAATPVAPDLQAWIRNRISRRTGSESARTSSVAEPLLRSST